MFVDGAPTGPAFSLSEGQHIHSFYPSTVDGFSCGKLLKID